MTPKPQSPTSIKGQGDGSGHGYRPLTPISSPETKRKRNHPDSHTGRWMGSRHDYAFGTEAARRRQQRQDTLRSDAVSAFQHLLPDLAALTPLV
ncbi:hypothetical protein BC567DRAFT_237602 [Phyllosticta citribraziliensis]